jgi:hypothetical protein
MILCVSAESDTVSTNLMDSRWQQRQNDGNDINGQVT